MRRCSNRKLVIDLKTVVKAYRRLRPERDLTSDPDSASLAARRSRSPRPRERPPPPGRLAVLRSNPQWLDRQYRRKSAPKLHLRLLGRREPAARREESERSAGFARNRIGLRQRVG